MAVSSSLPSTAVAAKSSHLADGSIQPFLQPDFDPIAHLNASLPPLALSASSRTTSSTNQQNGKAAPLPELSSQLQSLLSQLNAQATRISNALTQLTDEIIRSGGRLAYEVEVLRGETLNLTDSFENGLRQDMELFVPGSKETPADGKPGDTPSEANDAKNNPAAQHPTSTTEPEYLDRLRTLTAVRARLDAVIKVFGEAMQWPIAPSELSLTSSLISVSTPDSADGKSLEEKGKAFSEKLRNEILELVSPAGSEDGAGGGIEAAQARIADLRSLVEVWTGTAEEKARGKLVDGLQRLVDERVKALGNSNKGATAAGRAGAGNSNGLPARGIDMRYGNLDSSAGAAGAAAPGGYGFLQNLRNLKTDVYLE